MVAALYVETDGGYFGVPGVDPWDEARDARKYTGPLPVVAHPPCQRWGRYWHGAPNKPNQFRLGEDQGCFAAALTAVRNYGGVLEHPAHSRAWEFFGLSTPPAAGGWVKADNRGGTHARSNKGTTGTFPARPHGCTPAAPSCPRWCGGHPNSAFTHAPWNCTATQKPGASE